LMLLALPTYSQVKLSAQTAITSLSPTDIMWWNTDVGGVFTHRKMTWAVLAGEISDTMNSKTNTWALKQTFSSGATFSAGANGKVSFADSVQFDYPFYTSNFFPKTANGAVIGWSTQPYYKIYASEFVPVNTEGNDSCVISYDDSTLSFSKAVSFSGLTITESVGVDSGAAFTGMIWSNVEYTVSTAADSIITLTTYAPSVELVLPADVNSPGISRIHVNEATKGQIIRLWNPGLAYVIAFTQSVGDDDNLVMAGNDTLAYADNITFQYIGLSGGKQIWMEVNRSDNVQ